MGAKLEGLPQTVPGPSLSTHSLKQLKKRLSSAPVIALPRKSPETNGLTAKINRPKVPINSLQFAKLK
jgi:hypothetical protein